MHRSVLLSMSFSSMLVLLTTTACVTDSASYGNDQDYLRPVRVLEDDDDGDEAPPTTKPAPSSSARPQAPATKPPPSSSASSSTTPPATCDPEKATTKADCQKCCAAKPATSTPAPKPATSCACGGGSKCGALCESSLCRGETPNVACGICLVVAKCDPSDAAGGASASNAGDACQAACTDKP